MVGFIFLRKMRRDLWLRKGAILALVAIVTVGIGVYIGMAAVYRDLDGSRERFYRANRLVDFSVNLKRIPEQRIQALSLLPNVAEIRGRVQQSVLIDLPNRILPISGTILSMPMQRVPVLNDILLRSGTWFSGDNRNEVIVDDAFAKAHGLLPGSRIRALLLDKQHDLLVVGTALSPEFVYLIPPGGGIVPDPAEYGVLYMPEEFLQESSDTQGAFNQIVGRAHDSSPSVLDSTLRFLEKDLDAYGVVQTIPTRDLPSFRFLADELIGLRVSARVMPSLFLIVAALVLNVLMSRLVAQQRSVIGALRALGYTKKAILFHYLGYGLSIGLIGGISGTLFGIWLQSVFVVMYRQFFALPDINVHFYPDILFSGIFISSLFAVLGTVNGVRRAVSLEPAEAMKPPPPERTGKVLPERIPAVWKRLPFRWKMILRAVFRNPFRSAVSVIATLISTALIQGSLCNVDALHHLMDFEFKKISHQDLTVSLRDPVNIRSRHEIELFPTVRSTEAQLVIACDLSNGLYQKRIGVTGLPQKNHLNTPLDRQGNPIAIPESGLLLSDKLAEILHVARGDKIHLRPLIGERKEVETYIVGTFEAFLGLPVYADIRYLSRLLGEEWVTNTLLTTSYGDLDHPSFLREIQRRPTIIGLIERLRSFRKLEELFNQSMGSMIAITVLFSGLIAFGSILNGALVSVSEREREVGTLRVLGYTPVQIARIFFGESFLLSGIGILLGLLAGVGLVHLLSMAYSTEIYRFPVVILPIRFIQSTALMILFVGLAQGIVYRMIRKMEWLEVLKVKE